MRAPEAIISVLKLSRLFMIHDLTKDVFQTSYKEERAYESDFPTTVNRHEQ